MPFLKEPVNHGTAPARRGISQFFHGSFSLLSISRCKSASMKRLTTLVLIVFLFVASVGAWITRGFYDRIFMMEGCIHIVSNLPEDQTIELIFPSSETRSVSLTRYGAKTIRVRKTGEGSIAVTRSGETSDVGYVTSKNGIIVLHINPDRVGFSQIFCE